MTAADLTNVRSEDVFNIEAMHKWLMAEIGEIDEAPQVEQFRSGASNLTYLLKYPGRELVLRRPPVGKKAASAHDMKREVLIQRKLASSFPYVPKVLALCEDHAILGADFYVMERIPGVILRTNIPSDLASNIESLAAIGDELIDRWVELHQVNPEILSELNKGPGYVARQVTGWSNRYIAALTDDVPDAKELIAWLEANQPEDVATCIIHGDWRLDNMVFNFDSVPKLVGVLDWELATVGDPLMDLGSSLAYWIDRDDEPNFAKLRRQPSDLEGMPSRQEIVSRYLSQTNWKCDDFTFYEVFGLFRLTVILQQIWARYRAGETTNPAFAEFGNAVNVMIERAMGIIK